MKNVLIESNFTDIEVLQEQTEKGKQWYIEGIFMQSGVVNRNRRIYPEEIMENEIQNYQRNWIDKRRSVGELSHPNNLEINLEKITHITEQIRRDGNNYIGKAKVLNTPCGKIVEGLLEGGVVIGVSSRASGSLKRLQNGINEVQSDFSMRAIDIVFHPSAPDSFVEGLMEGANWIQPASLNTIEEDVEFIESLRQELDTDKQYKLQEAKLQAFNKMMDYLSGKR